MRSSCSSRAPLPNPLASSMDEHRLIRHPYGDHAGLCPHDRPCLCRLGPAVGTISASASTPPPARSRSPATARPGPSVRRRTGPHRQGDGGDAARRAAAALSATRRAGRRTRLLDGHRRRAVCPGHRRGAGAASRRAGQRDPASADARPHGRSRAGAHRHRRPAHHHGADTVVVAAGAWVGRLLPWIVAWSRPARSSSISTCPPISARSGRRVRWSSTRPAMSASISCRRPKAAASRSATTPSAGAAIPRPTARRSEEEMRPLLRSLPQPDQGLRALAHRPAESLLLYGDRGRAVRRREAGRQGLADVALLGSRLQVRRGDGARAGAHHRLGARSGGACALGGRSGRR